MSSFVKHPRRTPVLALSLVLVLGLCGEAAAESFVQRRIPPEEISQILAGQTSEATRDGRRLFSLAAAMDGRLWSAWASDSPADAWLEFHFPTTRYVTRIQILCGHAMDPKAWKATRRIKTLKLEYDGGERLIHLKDSLELVTFDFPQAIVTTKIRLSAVATYGSGPIAISEIVMHEPADIFALKPELKEEIGARISQLSDPEARKEAIDSLRAIGAPALTWLMLALNEEDADARHGALLAIVATATTAGIDPVAEALLRAAARENTDKHELDFVRLGLGYLGSQHTPRAVEVGLVFQNKPAWRALVQREVMGCLAAAGHPDALPHLAAGLRGDPDVAMAAMPGFATLGEPGVAALAVLASEDNGELRMRVAQALSFITDGRASTLVAKLAVDPDPAVRAQTLRTVGALRDPSLLHLALDGTSDTRSNVRQAAVEALGQVPSDAALDHLAKLSEGPDRGLAVAAVKAMAGRAEAALPVLVNLVVTKTSARVADEVDRTLTAMGARFPAEITGALTPHLPGPSGQRAAHLMAACGEPGAKVLLDTMSETGYGRQVFFAQRALLARPAEAVGPIEEALAADPREYETPVVSRYLSVLSASGDPSTVATIGKIAADPRDRLRAEAMSSLRPFETAEATELLIGGLQDSWRDVREQSAIILGERKVVAAIPQLAQLIRADDEIILRAIWALGNIGDKSALMDLHAVLHHRRAAVRQYACAALATIGDSSSLIYLIKLIEDEDELVRGQAVRAMSRIE